MLPASGPAAVTIGAFDGVHLGHQRLLAATAAASEGGITLAITFDPHPAALFAPGRAPELLTDLPRRVELLHQHGADEVRVLAFSREMAAWEPGDFISRVVLDQCHATAVVVGSNFRFGHRAAGTVRTLAEHGERHGFSAVELPLLADAEVISSTRIRAAVAAGDLSSASRLLGRPHEVAGVVAHGDHRGRELGFPTANIPVPAGIAVPPDGVYAGWLTSSAGDRWPAAISVGTNPTFEGDRTRRIEAYVLDRDDLELYDRAVRVEFCEMLRPMVTFGSVDDLLSQMARDVEDTRAALAGRVD